jgi:hypothetical protein
MTRDQKSFFMADLQDILENASLSAGSRDVRLSAGIDLSVWSALYGQ